MTNLRRVDLNLFTVFEAIYQERSLTRAADRIGMSQPAASNALKRLREALGDPLFVRQGKAMEPTPKARELAVHVFRALDDLRRGMTSFEAFDPASQTRTFNIAGTEHLEHVMLSRLVKLIGPYTENLKINVTGALVHDLKSELKSGAIDLAVDHLPLADDEFEAEQIGEDSLVILVRKGHPMAGKDLDLHETLSLKYVVPKARDDRGFAIERFLRSHSAPSCIALRVNHFYAMLSAIENSDFAGVVPRQILQHVGGRFEVAPVKTAMPERHFQILMIWHRSQTHDPANRWLRELVAKAYQRTHS